VITIIEEGIEFPIDTAFEKTVINTKKKWSRHSIIVKRIPIFTSEELKIFQQF
jgi:hypothetical protein